ncbi:LOW QUALITY PROTEIN: hypothetical protein HID58_092708 [Brassica napus]|uniref:Uncharacterized protein n=1 Tax=Brassica napus TaxID=3708 RepID=A0ABQ7XDH3_BRANA|nr:LOW QUALITY PROTEIN: hypothetical protein HID58_092708 [Brassica napus]
MAGAAPSISVLHYGMIGRRRLVVVVLSPASVVDKPGDPALRVVPYGENPSCPSWLPDKWKISIYLKAGEITWPGRRRKVPDSETRTRDPEAGTWKTEARAGNNMTFFIGLYKFHRSITLPCRSFSDALALGMRHCPHGGDMPELAESLMEKPEHRHKGCLCGFCSYTRPQLRQGYLVPRIVWRSVWYPGILRGRILARLRIRRTKRLNKTRRPKLWILTLDYTGLACASRACKGCNGLSGGSSCRFPCCVLASSLDCTLTFGRGDIQHISWTGCLREQYIAICPSEVSHHQCWDDLASCFHGTQRILGMLSQNLEVRGCVRRLYRLSSRNPEAGWTLVREPIACMDLSPGTLRIFFREPDGCVDLQGDLPVYLFNLKSSSSVSFFAPPSYPLGSLKDGTRCVRLVNLEYRDASHSTFKPGGESFFQMVDRGLDEYFHVSDLFEGDLVGFGTLILYFSGRQDLLSGLVTHKFRKTGVFLTPSLGISVSYNLSRGAVLETWRGTDPEFPREFVGGKRPLFPLEGSLPGKSGRIRRPACLDVEFAFFFGSFAEHREAVFPVLGQGSFRGTTPMEILKPKEKGGSPVTSLWLPGTPVVFPGALLLTPPVFRIRPSGVGSLEVWMSSRACLVMAAPIGPKVVETCSEDPRPAGVNNCRHRLWVGTRNRQIRRLRGSDLRIGPGTSRNQGLQKDPKPAGTRDCRKSDLRIGPGTSRNQGLQEDPEPAGTRDCRKSDLRIGPRTSCVVLSSLEEVFPAV